MAMFGPFQSLNDLFIARARRSGNHRLQRPYVKRRVIKRHLAQEVRLERAERRYWKGRHDWATLRVEATWLPGGPKAFIALDTRGMRLEWVGGSEEETAE